MAEQGKTQQQGLQRQPQQQQQMGRRENVRSPFSLMRRMMEDMDRMFDDFAMGRGLGDFGGMGSMSTWNPQIEVFQKNDKLVVRADLPGLKKEDVRVHFTGDELVIEGERKHEDEKEENGVYHSERSYGSFERRIPLPRGVDMSTCDASFENGVLEVNLALPKEQRRQIPVKGATSQTQQTTQKNGPQAQQPQRH